MRMPEPDKFNKTELARVAVTPWDMHVPREMEVVFKDKSDEKQETMKDKVTMSREVYIKGEIRAGQGSWGRSRRPHSAE